MGIGELESRLDQLKSDQLGHHVGDAHREPRRTALRSSLERSHHFPAKGKDFVGVAKHDLPSLRENQVSPGFAKELFAERPLKRFELRAHGRLREMQLFTGARDAAEASDGPKV